MWFPPEHSLEFTLGVSPYNKEVAGVKSLSHLASPDAKVHFQYARTGIMKSQLRVVGPRIWNSIDSLIVDTSLHLHSFKNKLKKQMLSIYI